MGAPWGSAVGPLAHALPQPLRATSTAQATGWTERRRLCGRRDTKRSDWRGVRAAAITSGVRCLRYSQRPGFGHGGSPGGRSGGRDGTTAQRRERTERQFVQRARSRAAGRETRPRSPGTGQGRCSLCCRWPPAVIRPPLCPRTARWSRTKIGPKAPGVTRGQARPCMLRSTYMAECGLIW